MTLSPIGQAIFEDRYAAYEGETIEQMWQRVANTVGRNKQERRDFLSILEGWKFVPGGRILAAAGSGKNITYYNCYVLPCPTDSRGGIIKILDLLVETISRGGGVGVNISSLRPKGAVVRGVNGHSSGSISWGALYSFATGLIEQGGSRRGALMLMLNDWHPDLLEFITSKRQAGHITNANISVAISDAFMHAVKEGLDWTFRFPDTSHHDYDNVWNGNFTDWVGSELPVIEYDTMPARQIWDLLCESAWASGEPGVWFSDRSQAMSNTSYYNMVIGTNPCGEQPLPAWSVCNLGALNLPAFMEGGCLDLADIWHTAKLAVRFLDNVIDKTPYFLKQNRIQQMRERRIGLGTMGLAEVLIRKGMRYGSDESIQYIDSLYQRIALAAYFESIELSKTRGCFQAFDSRYWESPLVGRLAEIAPGMLRSGNIRNATLLTQAPNGTTGTMVGTSTGIEPYFAWEYSRASHLGTFTERVSIHEEWVKAHPGEPLPDYFVTAMDLKPEEHVKVQAAVQYWVDSAVSKTCNIPSHYTPEQVGEIYMLMYDSGCKGGTVYRDGSRDEQVLTRDCPTGICEV